MKSVFFSNCIASSFCPFSKFNRKLFQPFISGFIFKIAILTSILIFLIDSNIQAQQTRTCLNGWWDFVPVYGKTDHSNPTYSQQPIQGWVKNGILVPGSWSSGSSESGPGEPAWKDWQISKSFDTPIAWDSASTAWYKTTFKLDSKLPNRLYSLRFDGILRESWIYVNGIEVSHRKEGTLPSEHDITSALKLGENEIAVYVTDYKRDENGRTFVNVGADQMGSQHGIWGDVYLESKPAVNIQDITIQTSVRNNELTLIYTISNKSKKDISVTPEFQVEWQNKTFKTFQDKPLTIESGKSVTCTKVETWSNYIAWTPNNPQLYNLDISLKTNDQIIDKRTERFGFREIWGDGHNFMLNGKPIHMLGEWGHKDHFGFLRPEYVRQWFGMLKALNMNYIRTHTFPHPKWMIDMADEMGIMVCLESGWFMSGSQAMDKDEYWDNGKEYARSIIQTYKNHPSIILWSVGNEVRWGWNLNAVIKHGPEIQKIYDEMDPTRIAFSDGSTSLWDERPQPIISRHYGLECTGEDFWDKTKPLHVGEFGKWHYGQPIDNLVWGNDEVFSSFKNCVTAIAEEASDIILQGRSNEVSCMFPWNLSCLDNYRPSNSEIHPIWNDFTGPYAKPTRVGPYSSEFTWWIPESKGYIPGEGFKYIQHANRPFAIYIREKLNQSFDNQKIKHTVSLINDLGNDVNGILKIEGYFGKEKVFEKDTVTSVKSGYASRLSLILPEIQVKGKTVLTVKTSFIQGRTVIDTLSREIQISPAAEKTSKINLKECLVFGPGTMEKFLKSHHIVYRYLKDLSEIAKQPKALLIIEKNSIVAGSDQNKIISEFISNGGRVFIMEQENNALPGYSIDTKPSETCFIRSYEHQVMNNFTDQDFAWWGNDPYSKSNSDSYVAVKPYGKPTAGNSKILLDCGFGDFGNGGLNWTPLFETRIGKGIAIVSQLRLTEKMETIPAANNLVCRILSYLESYQSIESGFYAMDSAAKNALEKLGIPLVNKENSTVFLAGNSLFDDKNESKQVYDKMTSGATVVIQDLDSISIAKLAAAWNIDIQAVNLGPQFNLIREHADELINGISNQETNWLDKGTYTPESNKNHKITDWLFTSKTGISLLSSETESCWREFYTQSGSGEWLRMPVVTHLLYNGPRKHASGMMKFSVGKGTLVLTQIPLPESNYRKAEIFWTQLFSNLNVSSSYNPFEGNSVTHGNQLSNGYPESIRLIKNPDKTMLQEIIQKGDPGETSERFQNQGLSDGFSWERIKTSNGTISLTDECREVVLYSQIYTGRPRKLSSVAGDWPDPMQQTLVDFAGKGQVTLYVNGKKYDSVMLSGDKATISDIDLNQFWNTILIHFVPDSRDLKIQWHNRQNQAEYEFKIE